jgi:hypothetical protein
LIRAIDWRMTPSKSPNVSADHEALIPVSLWMWTVQGLEPRGKTRVCKLLQWAGQGSNLRPWDKKSRSTSCNKLRRTETRCGSNGGLLQVHLPGWHGAARPGQASSVGISPEAPLHVLGVGPIGNGMFPGPVWMPAPATISGLRSLGDATWTKLGTARRSFVAARAYGFESRSRRFETTCATTGLWIPPPRLNAPAAKTFAPLAVW